MSILSVVAAGSVQTCIWTNDGKGRKFGNMEAGGFLWDDVDYFN